MNTLQQQVAEKTQHLSGEFTFSIFGTSDMAEDFIWGFLYDNGKQYLEPFTHTDGKTILIYEQ